MQQPAPTAEQMQQHLADLHECWRTAPHRTIKITAYFPAYVQVFAHLRGTKCTFVETGILDGGSLFMWRQWLGPQARIIGVDLNPEVAKWRDSGFEIFIGDQGDPEFWRKTLQEIGEFDALLDDGGHQSFQQIVTLREALRGRTNPCVVAIEDTTTSFMKDFANHGTHSFLNFAKDSTDCLVGRSFEMAPDRYPSSYNKAEVEFFQSVFSVQFFNGIVAYWIDPESCIAPKVIANMTQNTESDFRYEGKDSATVPWPALLQAQEVNVKGGMLKAGTSSGLPKLHLGCGQDYWDGYINIDLDPQAKADRFLDLKDLRHAFGPGSVSEICGYHVLNYLSYWDACSFFKDSARMLASGGKLILETVNLETVARLLLNAQGDTRQYLEGIRAIHGFGLDHMEAEMPYTPNRFSWTAWHLRQELEAAGFSDIKVLPAQSHAPWRDMRLECVRAG